MAPFPEEVDVFSAPHWRMKKLVNLYSEKVVTELRAAKRPAGGKGERQGEVWCGGLRPEA